MEINKEILTNEVLRWIKDHDGKQPTRDDMNTNLGYISNYQFTKFFKTRKWNICLELMGFKGTNLLWDLSSEDYIRENYLKLSDKEISEYLNRTEDSTRSKRNELGLLRTNKTKKFTSIEIDYLRKNFYSATQEDIESNIPDMKWVSIKSFANKTLKLNRKNKLYIYQTDEGKRMCKKCEIIFDENSDNFYNDKNSFRTLCINCWNEESEIKFRKNGVITRKLRKELLESGTAYCGKCEEWLNVGLFRKNFNDIYQIHRYCEACERAYLKEYNLISCYGDNYKDSYIEKSTYFDLNKSKCDSLPEKIITDWLIGNGVKYRKHPFYREFINGDNSKKKFDWVLEVDNSIYFVEYFGLWNNKKGNKWTSEYTKKAKKKIALLYKKGLIENCILIFPKDLKSKTLEDIFTKISKKQEAC